MITFIFDVFYVNPKINLERKLIFYIHQYKGGNLELGIHSACFHRMRLDFSELFLVFVFCVLRFYEHNNYNKLLKLLFSIRVSMKF